MQNGIILNNNDTNDILTTEYVTGNEDGPHETLESWLEDLNRDEPLLSCSGYVQ